MSDTKRDLWSWAELSVSVVSGIAIALLLGYFGWQYRLGRQEARNTDRIRNATQICDPPPTSYCVIVPIREYVSKHCFCLGLYTVLSQGGNNLHTFSRIGSTGYDTIPNHFELWLAP